MEKCDMCRLALNDQGYPYIVPLNFGMEVSGRRITLYFHGASEGKKLDLLQKDRRAGFKMDCAHKMIIDESRESCAATMEYESIIGKGLLEIVPEEEKHHALCALMRHYGRTSPSFSEPVVSKTTLFKLAVEEVTGKSNRKR